MKTVSCEFTLVDLSLMLLAVREMEIEELKAERMTFAGMLRHRRLKIERYRKILQNESDAEENSDGSGI